MVDEKHIIAAAEFLLIFPAVLFLTAVAARSLNPLEHFAQQIVTWYSVRRWTLWILLIFLPFTALLTGCATLLWNASTRAERWLAANQSGSVMRIIITTSLTAGIILLVVVLHMLAN